MVKDRGALQLQINQGFPRFWSYTSQLALGSSSLPAQLPTLSAAWGWTDILARPHGTGSPAKALQSALGRSWMCWLRRQGAALGESRVPGTQCLGCGARILGGERHVKVFLWGISLWFDERTLG